MAKALFVTYLIALTTCLISAYKQDCAVGPAYWCKSFQNAEDCGALRHCTDTVWRYDGKHTTVDLSTKCEWCQKIIKNTHKAINNIVNNEDLIKSTLVDGCKLLPLEDISSKCTTVMEKYTTTVFTLMKHQRYDTLCHLMNICPSETFQSHENKEETSADEQSRMLCNVIVRATHDLHVNQQKSRMEIQTFLKDDCQHLTNTQFTKKCEDLIERHGNEIYAHVASNVELSKVCDYIESSAPQPVSHAVPCELCTFVLATAKQMIDAKNTEDKVLLYIDEQVCSRLTGMSKKKCKEMIDTNGRDFVNDIRNGKQPMLLCTHLQLCHNEILDTTSPIQKEEMHSFLMNNLCGKLGSLKSACEALIEKDSTRLLHILTHEINGNELCHMFGLCPKNSPLLNELALKDDPSKCKRCVKDFTRRKHIAERLVNHSSEFLHHFCEQLPQADDCIKSVDGSINELLTFIRSLDPKNICIQLNMCDQKSLSSIQTIDITPSNNAINEEIIEYIKTDVCVKLGSLSSLCIQLVESEGLNLFNQLSKTIDPHQICSIIDVCPSAIVFENCHDKCQCCMNKIEIYQKELEKFMRAIVASTRIMCDYVPGRDVCLQLADVFESNVNKAVARFDSKRTCQLLSLCSSSEMKTNEDPCKTCTNELNIRQNRFRETIDEIAADQLSLCKDESCRSRVQSTYQTLTDKMNNFNSPKTCQRIGYCLSENLHEPSETTLRLKSLVQQQTQTLEERLQAHDICAEFRESKTMCEHIMISVNNHRYAYIYMSLLKNNPKLIDDDLREQMSTDVHADVCQSCKDAVQSSKDFWGNNLESVRNVLLRTCEYCPSKDECRDYTNQRFDNIKSYLNNIDPTQFCQTMHLCSTSASIHPHPHEPKSVLVNLLPEYENEEINDSNSTCILCEYAMNILSSYIHQKSTEEEIEQDLQKVCQEMPATLRSQCHELIDNYGPSIIAVLIGHFDASTVCQKLNLCTKQMKVELSHITKANQATCGVCDYVSTYMNFVLKRDSSEKSLEHALSTVCSHLSNEQSPQCETLVGLFRPHFRKLELQRDNNFCKQLTICQTPMGELKPAIQVNLRPLEQHSHDDNDLKEAIINNLDLTPECTLCHYVVSYLDAVIKNNKSQEAVEAALARVCTILPKKDRVKCSEFVKNYGPVLADLIIEVADPRLICRYLGMCLITTDESKPIIHSDHHDARIAV
ncbi:unnamed protein product [Adineta steineri]|uniref:Proactivator polypeptide n=1 Tax=Adineta steineri TaxID=433720 RepID=A0A819IJ01_9BILA|nr:unnamed protein product [Adineta steineri]